MAADGVELLDDTLKALPVTFLAVSYSSCLYLCPSRCPQESEHCKSTSYRQSGLAMNWRVQSPVSPTHSQQVRRRLPSNIRVVVDTICLRPLRLCLRLRLRLRLRLHFASAFADLASASDVLACPSSIRRFVSASASAWLLCFRSRLPRCLSACDLLLAQPSTSPIAQWVSLPLARSNTVPFHPPSPLNPLLTCTHKHALPEVRPPLTPPPPVGPPLSYLTSLTHLPQWGPHFLTSPP